MASNRQAMASAIREVMTTDARPGLAAMTTPVWAVYAADADDSDEPVDHPAIAGLFGPYSDGKYKLRPLYRH